ncbi:MAG: hypothetical protein ACXABD_19160 [Candidatus Thorarchaeota archaeon]|jgi:hypothetical protein
MPTDWEWLELDTLVGGYNTILPPDKIPKGHSPKIENMIFSKGKLETDDGYITFGAAVRGNPRLIYQFEKKSGSSEVLLITNLTTYRWNIGQWQYLVGDNSTTVDGAHTATDDTILVADSTGFVDGDFIGITQSDGSMHMTTVNGAPAGNLITITDAITVDVSAGAAFIEAVVLSGSDNVPVQAATLPADDVVIITNGKDNVKRYDGTDCIDVPNLVTAVGGGNCYARGVLVSDNKVILFRMNENGTDYPQRIRWCATGDHTDWTTSGDSGFEDLYGDEDPIETIVEHGPYKIVYRSRSVDRMEWVGSANFIYFFQTTLSNEGGGSLHCVVSQAGVHKVLGRKSFYSYNGGFSLEKFGEEVWESVFGQDKTISSLYIGNSFVNFIEATRRYYFMLPSDGNSYPSRAWIFDPRHNSWTTRVFADKIFSIAEVDLLSGTTWAEAVGLWNANAWSIPWNDVTLISGTNKLLLCGIDGDENPQIFEYSSDSTDDDGETITGEYRTGELYAKGDKIRIDKMEVRAKGSSITVEYSEDRGTTWTSYGSLAPGSSYADVEIFKQLIAVRIMFRFTGSQYGLDRVRIKQKIESVH